MSKPTHRSPEEIAAERQRLRGLGLVPISQAVADYPGLASAARGRLKVDKQAATRVSWTLGPQRPGVRGRTRWVHAAKFNVEPLFSTRALQAHCGVSLEELEEAFEDRSLRFKKPTTRGKRSSYRVVSLADFVAWRKNGLSTLGGGVWDSQPVKEAVAEAGAPKVNHLKEQAKRGRRFLAAQAEAKAAADKDEVVTNGWGPGSLLEVSLVGGGTFVSSGDDYCVRDENGDLVIIKKLAVIPAFD